MVRVALPRQRHPDPVEPYDPASAGKVYVTPARFEDLICSERYLEQRASRLDPETCPITGAQQAGWYLGSRVYVVDNPPPADCDDVEAWFAAAEEVEEALR